jgi:hypothetical protein
MRLRTPVITLAAPLLLFAVSACGSSGSQNAAQPNAARATTTQSTFPDGMTAEQMKHMRPTARLAHPLAVRADGRFDPAKVDLGGIYGVTPTERKRAETLLRKTLKVLPHWDDTATAEKEGFHSIGDALTGDEHWIHWDWIDDNDYLDPAHPESLVYHVDGTGKRTLEAAMFLLPKKFTFSNLPDVGGPLVQFHVHDNLCFTNTPPAYKVAGITSDNGPCTPPLVNFHPNVMMHVWLTPNPCGPFAALEGVGAGQTAPGTTKACDEHHGDRL